MCNPHSPTNIGYAVRSFNKADSEEVQSADVTSDVYRASEALSLVLHKAGIKASREQCVTLIASQWRTVSVAAHALHDAIVTETTN